MTATAVRERPIPFSGPMVKAIMDGRKTQTRRVVKPPYRIRDGWPFRVNPEVFDDGDLRYERSMRCPYGQPGDRLWIKTGYQTQYDAAFNQTFWSVDGVGYITTHGRALSKSGKPKRDGKHAGMYMPYWLSQELRLPVLEVTDVRVERVQEITEADAKAEGVEPGCLTCGESCIYTGGCGYCRPAYRDSFIYLWRQLNEARGYGWEANPFCWVVSFKRVESL